VIIGMHHDQDIRNMGGLRKYMPITWITSLLGSLALIGTPFFSGFYSKDSIIEAVHFSTPAGCGFAYFAVLAGRVRHGVLLVPHVLPGLPRQGALPTTSPDPHHDDHMPPRHGHHEPHESPWVVTVPLVLLAIPSVVIGFMTIGSRCSSATSSRTPSPSTQPAPGDGRTGAALPRAVAMALHGLTTARSGWPWPAWCWRGVLPGQAGHAGGHRRALSPLYTAAREQVLHGLVQRERAGRRRPRLGLGLWKGGDVRPSSTGCWSMALRRSWAGSGRPARAAFQTGYLYHYALS
jgi:NADH-quinone oxidoreductase subunit L